MEAFVPHPRGTGGTPAETDLSELQYRFHVRPHEKVRNRSGHGSAGSGMTYLGAILVDRSPVFSVGILAMVY
jgi:hypothetical protein